MTDKALNLRMAEKNHRRAVQLLDKAKAAHEQAILDMADAYRKLMAARKDIKNP